MSAGVSVFLILVGAILRFAVTWSPQNVNLQVIGVILMIGGGAGLIASIVLITMRNRNKRSAEVFEQRRYIEPPVLSTGAGEDDVPVVAHADDSPRDRTLTQGG